MVEAQGRSLGDVNRLRRPRLGCFDLDRIGDVCAACLVEAHETEAIAAVRIETVDHDAIA